MAAETYAVTQPLVHDGKQYSPGMMIELGETNASYLLKRRAIVHAPPEKTKTKAGNKAE